MNDGRTNDGDGGDAGAAENDGEEPGRTTGEADGPRGKGMQDIAAPWDTRGCNLTTE